MRHGYRAKLVGLISVLLLLAGFAFGEPNGNERDEGGAYVAAFERLKSLVGTWEYERDGERREVVYSLTADGSALIERFTNMSSVYHLDGSDLRVTHYCGAKNQPRMKAYAYDPEKGVVSFDFVDVTNVAKPDDYHTREVRITFFNENHAEVYFNGLDNGEPVPVTIDLWRLQSERGR